MAAEGFATLLHIMLSEAPGGFQIILFSLSICVVPLGQPIHRCGIATVVPFLREVLHPPNGLRQLLVILRIFVLSRRALPVGRMPFCRPLASRYALTFQQAGTRL